MKTFIRQILPGLSALGLLWGTTSAPAGTTYTWSAVQPATLTDWQADLLLPQFDPTQGTLEAVHLTASFELNLNGTLSNLAPTPQQFWFQAGSLLSVSLPNQLGTLKPSDAANKLYYSLGPGEASPYGSFTLNNTVDLTLTGAALNAFIGTGTVDLAARTLSWDSLSGGGGNISADLTSTAGAVVTLEYLDSPVPEPSSGALLALALGGLTVRLRKR